MGGGKRAREWIDVDDGQYSPRRLRPYSAQDVAAALNIPLLDDGVLVRVVLPLLRGAQKRSGFVPFNVLGDALACVLTDGSGTNSQCCAVLHQFAVDRYIFNSELVHEKPDAASVFCACLSVDPWNSVNAVAACHVGNFNQVC